MPRRALRWLWLLLPLMVAGCVDERSAARAVGSDWERSRYEIHSERRLARIDADIDGLRHELESRESRQQAELRRELDNLELKRQRTRRQIDELKSAGDERWMRIQREIGEMLGEIDGELGRVRVRFDG